MFTKLIVAFSLATAGCTFAGGAPISPVGPVSAATVGHIELTGTDALSKAADAYAGVSILAEGVVRHGVLSKSQLLQLRILNDRAYALISGADKALTATERAAGLFAIVGQIHSIVGA